MGKVGDLSELHGKYFERGFRVVAISNEPLSKLKAEMLDARQASYWIGSDPRSETIRSFVEGERIGIPQFYLIDAKGRVVGEEIPSAAQIEELLADIFDVELGREMPPELQGAEQAYRDGAYGRAWRAAVEAADSKDGVVAAEAGFLRDKVVDYAAFLRRSVPHQLEGKDPEEAYGRLLLLTHQFEGLELSTWASEQLEELAGDARIERHKKAWRKLAEAVQRDLRSGGKAYERKRARELYEKVIAKFARTAPARLAEERAGRLADAR